MRHSRRKKQARVKGTSRKKSKTEAHTSSPSARQHDAHDNDASASDTADLDYASNLDLIQVNLKRSPARMGCLIDHLPHMDPPPDVVAIQDPPPEFAWKSCPGYNIEYLPARELLEKDNPKTTEDPVSVKLVGFHITQSIDPSEWRIDWREHDNKHFGSQSISMSEHLTGADQPVTGEGGDGVAQVKKDAEILHQATAMAGMRCLLPPGLRTYSRSATDSGDFLTTIDLVFAGRRLESRAHSTRALSVPGFESDHRPLHTRVSVAPNRDKEPRFNWDRANGERYCEEVEKQLRTIGFPDIRTPDAVDDDAKALVVAIYQAVRHTIPCYRKTAPRPTPEVVPEDVQRAHENEANQLRILHELRSRRGQRGQEEKYRIAKNETRHAASMHKLASFRKNVASQSLQRQVERGKAAGPDDIISNALKVGWEKFYGYFKHLVNASFKNFHHPLCFRDATTIVFPKPDKEDYAQPKAYRSDISGAYDHVDRQAFLRILVKFGVPDWLVKWIASFLSFRRSKLRAPGHTSDWFYVNIGIPQGSPLSPILFISSLCFLPKTT
ncbi:hypothetical protein CSAL01_04875 [Colletotrichum salicis]|uniref:Reverse transcriptase domain-containing protein n=1 Tax=Colletotrichum salicis TaxID=1209931 RepID=A0A135T2J1_9PEZI|nr:hypothetical protein CSAL01_04875 [Colletotrichum salicis]